ncbi:MAG: phage Gp37/Gp68 family protein [Sneathiella sp.]
MAENTKIEWADATFNPWIGCTKISAACDNCYAEALDKRFQNNRWAPNAERSRTSDANWRKPLAWNKKAQKDGVRHRVFCASLADVFDNHKSITDEWRADLWNLIDQTPNLDWLLLTKRPQNIKKMLPESYGLRDWGAGWTNVWLGTTVEDQEQLNIRAAHLLSVPAKLNFLSCEPLLGPLDFTNLSLNQMMGISDTKYFPKHRVNILSGDTDMDPMHGVHNQFRKIDWVICGGESGPAARPLHPDWARSLRDQCKSAGVPFHFKQWGEWLPWEHKSYSLFQSQNALIEDRHNLFPSDFDKSPKWDDGIGYLTDDVSHAAFQRVGKKNAGRALDGIEHNEFPTQLKEPRP